jgi:outer membrane murein-binding lipoprotein Lpp
MSGSEPTPAAISEKSTFSWQVAVVLGACLAAVAGGLVRVDGIQRDADLLRSRVDLLERQQSADRGRLDVQAATLGEVRTLVLEVRTDVREVLRYGTARQASGSGH